MLQLIRRLYAVEKKCPRGSPEDPERLALLAGLGDTRSRPIIAEIHEWLLNVRILPESSLGKAVKYVRRFWRGLSRFLDDPRVELDNNRMKRALRGMTLGRKNFYGNWSTRGARAAEVAYSVIESAKLAGAHTAHRDHLDRFIVIASIGHHDRSEATQRISF